MPVIVATAISFVVSLLLKALTHKLIVALVNGYSLRHSVLGSTPDRSYWHLTTLKTVLFTLPISLLGQFLVICFFTFALVVTAWKALGITVPLFPVSGTSLRPLLWFSAKVFIAYHLLGFLVVIPMRFILLHSLQTYALLIGICEQILLTLVVAAMAIRFLARSLERHTTSAAIKSARWIGIITVTVLIALSFLVPRIEHPLFAFWPHITQPAVQAILLAGGGLATLPYAVLFVSLAFLLSDWPSVESSAFDLEPDPEPSLSAS